MSHRTISFGRRSCFRQEWVKLTSPCVPCRDNDLSFADSEPIPVHPGVHFCRADENQPQTVELQTRERPSPDRLMILVASRRVLEAHAG